jgi:DNA-binding response OmpR family regulator
LNRRASIRRPRQFTPFAAGTLHHARRRLALRKSVKAHENLHHNHSRGACLKRRRASSSAVSASLPRRREVLADGRPIGRGGRAFDTLMALIEANGAVVGKDELLARVWPGRVAEEGNLRA